MSSPLQRLIEGPAVSITSETLDRFLGMGGQALMLFTGDPSQRPEAQDVAVVAAELARQLPGLAIGVVVAGSEAELKARFQVSAVPTVLFMVDGKVKSTVARLQDWSAYAGIASLVFANRQGVMAS